MKKASISELLYAFGEATTKLLRDSYVSEKEKHPFPGNPDAATMIAAIDYKVKILGTDFVWTLLLPDYGKFQDEGVKGKDSTYTESSGSQYQFKNKMPDPKIFLGAGGWISRAGIKLELTPKRKKLIKGLKSKRVKKGLRQWSMAKAAKQAAWGIAKNIQKKGIRGTHFYSKVMTDDYLNNFQKDLTKALGRDVEIEIHELFKDLE